MSKNINLITLFSGMGTQEMGIKNVLRYKDKSLNLVHFCEIDKRIAKCFCILHDEDENKNLGDITILDTQSLPITCDIDIIISSFPCQSFSIAGKQKGFQDVTKGNLYDEGFKFISHIKPKVVVYENVKGILNHKYGAVEKITTSMNSIGYTCFHKVLNSRDYGIPQNRCRWFMVCIRRELCKNNPYVFPEPEVLDKSVDDFVDRTIKYRKCGKDMLKYFDSSFHKQTASKLGLIKVFDGVEQGFFKSGFTTHRIYSTKGISPTFTTSNDCHFLELKGKLHPKERFMLMGCTEKDYVKLKENNIPDSLIDFMSGNAIVVKVFEKVFQQLLCYF